MPRLDDAAALVLRDFRHITRKNRDIPYVSHLFAVMALVAEGGGDEDQLVAALLHDWLEDIPGASPEHIERHFGHRVRHIVEALTDTMAHPKPAWQARKEAWLATLAARPAEIKLVAAADKLHNAQGLLRDMRVEGLETFLRFSGGVRGTLWYYAHIVTSLRAGWDHWLVDELEEVVAELHHLAGVPLGTARP
jgi:(p)ppGpp synthase/HD superfamily hydrolase